MLRVRGSMWGFSALMLAATAMAGGTPENALLIIDPSKPESLYIGNYYKQARNIPDQNVMYLAPGAADYPSFVDYNLDALFGVLDNGGLRDHIDYVIVTPGAPYRIAAADLIDDGCSPVSSFSISACYTMAFISDEVLKNNLNSQNANRFYRNADDARGFDSNTKYFSGAPSNSNSARQYFIGAMLGYNGERGNTLQETIDMIDRSVASDGVYTGDHTKDGTFYFMKTDDTLRSGPRDGAYANAVTSIKNRGGNAERIVADLPIGKHDCIGIMTGKATLDIDGADMTILNGAFCDHLTSYAATFSDSGQTKLSKWISKGASGSWGTIEEPCNYAGKFPHARMHVYYVQGLSLGEACFRSVGFTPFQGLLYGDPLTRAFAYIPSVSVPDAPTEAVSGTITISPEATTQRKSTEIDSLELLIDGVSRGTKAPGGQFVIDTTQYSDGRHDLRVLAYDNSVIKNVGRWTGTLEIDNRGRTAEISVSPTSGDWTTAFTFDVSATGDDVSEIRLVQNGRVIAAAADNAASFTIYGLTLGAGPAVVRAEAIYGRRTRVQSEPVNIDVAYSGGSPSGQKPTVFGFTKFVRTDVPFLVELPATYDDVNGTLTWELVTTPANATPRTGQTAAYRLMDPKPGVCGLDKFTYRVKSGQGDSETVTVTLNYGFCKGDMDCDGDVNFNDIDPFVIALIGESDYRDAYPDCVYANADVNDDKSADFNDIDPFIELLTR